MEMRYFKEITAEEYNRISIKNRRIREVGGLSQFMDYEFIFRHDSSENRFIVDGTDEDMCKEKYDIAREICNGYCHIFSELNFGMVQIHYCGGEESITYPNVNMALISLYNEIVDSDDEGKFPYECQFIERWCL